MDVSDEDGGASDTADSSEPADVGVDVDVEVDVPDTAPDTVEEDVPDAERADTAIDAGSMRDRTPSTMPADDAGVRNIVDAVADAASQTDIGSDAAHDASKPDGKAADATTKPNTAADSTTGPDAAADDAGDAAGQPDVNALPAVPPDAPNFGFSNLVVGFKTAVVDVATQKVVDTWKLTVLNPNQPKLLPVEVRITQDDKILVTADLSDHKVSFCDRTKKGGACKFVTTGTDWPHGVAWTNDGQRALILTFEKIPSFTGE